MYVKVRVYPGAKKEEVREVGENRLEIKVREPAERNLANTRIKELLAERYKEPIKKVRLISGHQSPSKMFSIN
ncbi:hypothetical protein CL653_02645 [bacterium]|nr:hypothetical protein [bacterium]